ncbi:helix-turn-helix domain-containing protein [Mediterraneibacter gnavus]|uniref:helix-turn-helix domain-containing protein n=1 Tax=Mediterraneibacter gnavus TaxID=33038 RepID=UPI00366DD966
MELNIGERIEILRKDLSMSRRVFGERLGVSESVIVNIEYDRLKRPDQKESLYKLICKEFNVNEEWLRTGNGEMFVPLTRNQLITDFATDLIMEDNTFKKRLVEALAKLDESEWEVLEKLAESLIKKD